MATKSRGRVQQAKRVRAGARKPPPTQPQPVYFLSLTLKNVRCFGPEQTLKLSDDQGRPARWTVILGNNGMGKTTLLQALTTFEPDLINQQKKIKIDVSNSRAPKGYLPIGYAPRGFTQSERLPWLPIRHQSASAYFSVKVRAGTLAPAKDDQTQQDEIWHELSSDGAKSAVEIQEPFLNLACYGYGATRRMGSGSLSAPKETQPSDSLFFEDIPLRNAEEWLLQADYAASKQSPEQSSAVLRRDRIKSA
ncbi:AAA family ATPase [Melittangium boletus]|uniref:AAA family ATPase n=1 Tax=Melittangium boletus TaxID=83453 RepID=UPI000BB348F3|nr:AAA family ATPase [Melittangium boletus]